MRSLSFDFYQIWKFIYLFTCLFVVFNTINRNTQLFKQITPKTCQNFMLLCTGENGVSASSSKPLHYRNSIFHRIVPNGWIQGGGWFLFVFWRTIGHLVSVRKSNWTKIDDDHLNVIFQIWVYIRTERILPLTLERNQNQPFCVRHVRII